MSDAILAIRPRALGDVVLVTPGLRAILKGHPDATLEVLTEPRYAPLLEGLPGIARVHALERTHLGTLRTIAALRRRRYRAVVDFFGNPRTAAIAAACRASVRAGYDLRRRRRAYQIVVARELSPAPGRREYASATHVRLAVAAGGVADGLDARVAIAPDAAARADALFREAGVADPRATIGLVAAGTWPTKTWPLSSAIGLARRMLARDRDVLLLGGPGEAAIERAFEALAPGVRRLPACDVGALAAVVSRLGAVVGTDSGPRHLAAAFGVPTFTWFGPTHPDTWTPPGPHAYWRTSLPCRACDRTRCPHWNCMPSLTAGEAFDAVERHLEEVHGAAARLRSAPRA